jgi:hypothetical protein
MSAGLGMADVLFHRDRDFAPILNVEALVWSALAGFGGRNAKFPYKAHAILI